jgi:hypothetical protein
VHSVERLRKKLVALRRFLKLASQLTKDEEDTTAMTVDWFQQYVHIATEMNDVHALPGAEPGYDVLTDAIIWSDEYPSNVAGRMVDFDCLKLLFRYRTSILTGHPDETFRPYWDRAMELFPQWAGFASSRLVPSEELTKFYEHCRKRDMRYLRKVFCQKDEQRP